MKPHPRIKAGDIIAVFNHYDRRRKIVMRVTEKDSEGYFGQVTANDANIFVPVDTVDDIEIAHKLYRLYHGVDV